MPNTLVNLSGFQRGLEIDEVGINPESHSCRYHFQYKDKVNNFQGQVRGFAIPDKFCRELRLSGEVVGSTGVMATNGNTAFVPANDVGALVGVASGSNAGGFYFDEGTETQTRDGFRSFEGTWTSDPLVA